MGREAPPSVSWVGALARAVRYESATKKISKKMGKRKNDDVRFIYVTLQGGVKGSVVGIPSWVGLQARGDIGESGKIVRRAGGPNPLNLRSQDSWRESEAERSMDYNGVPRSRRAGRVAAEGRSFRR